MGVLLAIFTSFLRNKIFFVDNERLDFSNIRMKKDDGEEEEQFSLLIIDVM